MYIHWFGYDRLILSMLCWLKQIDSAKELYYFHSSEYAIFTIAQFFLKIFLLPELFVVRKQA